MIPDAHHLYLQAGPEGPASIPKSDITEKAVRAVAQQYFTTLKNRYRKQVDDAFKLKMSQKDKNGRIRDRCTSKAERRLAGVPAFEQKHNVSDIGRYILRGFQSPDHSDSGEATREEWENHRASINGGNGGLETRKISYRATWVSTSINLKPGSCQLILFAVDKTTLRTRQDG